MEMLMKPIIKTTVAMACVLFAVQSHATLIAHDSFLVGGSDYNTASNLPGQGPPVSGFTGNWLLKGDSSAATVNLRPTASGLSGFDAEGGAIESFRTGTGAGGKFLGIRQFSDDPQILAGESLYFSALVEFTTGNAVGVGMRFDARRHFGVGFNTDGTAGIWRGGTGGTDADNGLWEFLSTTPETFSANTTYLIVGRMDATNTSPTTFAETISLVGVFEVNDNIVEGNLLSTTFDVYFSESVLSGNFTGQTLRNASILFSKSTDGVAGKVDEIRYGTSFDVVAIPEPGTLLLVGVFLGAMVLLRRR
jgi:hypothetical protein